MIQALFLAASGVWFALSLVWLLYGSPAIYVAFASTIAGLWAALFYFEWRRNAEQENDAHGRD